MSNAEPTGTDVDRAFHDALLDDDPIELYEHAPCGYVSTLPDGTITKVNETFLAWTGHERTALVGRRRFQDLLAVGDRIFYETHVSPMLRMQGSAREIATEVTAADGRRLAVILNAVVQVDDEGRPRMVRIALFDARERRSYEQELLAARRRAEESEQRARALAQTLQASFLPPELLEIPGLDVGGAYRPAGDGFEVGGDFYDVFETGRGTWAIVLGDVCGKGVQAATVTALARYTVRAEALRTPYPSAVLASLHEAMLRSHAERFCTAILLLLNRTPSGFSMTISSGGHHPPLRIRDGRIDRVGRSGTILGILDDVRLHDDVVPLASGDVIVLHTDGVTEARRDGAFLEDEGLEALLLAGQHLDAQALADHLMHAAVDYQSGDTRDDIAVVVVRVP